MILPRIDAAWQHSFARSATDRQALLREAGLPCPEDPQAEAAAETFRPLAPPAFLRRIHPGDPTDPLLRQVLPLAEETLERPGYSADPLHESAAAPVPGVLQKYAGRALLMVTGACAIHCRYCFRRHFPYSGNLFVGEARRTALEHLRSDASLRETILSGGDPLLLGDVALSRLLDDLEAIPHLTRLRIHSRAPVVLPERITPELARRLGSSRLGTTLVIHCNHPRELAGEVVDALAILAGSGITLLNQSVLLRGVNDHADTLSELSETLFAARVLPYYLHLLDPVQGAAHFEVPQEEARVLMGEVRRRLPGYLVPRLVREVAGEPFKTPISL